jgi:hypothetical protein
MSDSTGGWNIWGAGGDRIRQFTVAVVSWQDALDLFKSENPDVHVLSRHSVGLTTIHMLRMMSGEITEWVPLDCKDKIDRPGVVPIAIEMKQR